MFIHIIQRLKKQAPLMDHMVDNTVQNTKHQVVEVMVHIAVVVHTVVKIMGLIARLKEG
jgi:hypothetical protein